MQEYLTVTSVKTDSMGYITAQAGDYRLPFTVAYCRVKDGKPMRPVATVAVGQIIILDRNINNYVDDFPDALKQGQQFDCVLLANNKRYPCVIGKHADGGYTLTELEAKKVISDGYIWVKCSELLNN